MKIQFKLSGEVKELNMQSSKVLVLAVFGFCFIASAQSQTNTTLNITTFLANVPKLRDTITKLVTDSRTMRTSGKVDGVLLKQDIEAVIKAAENSTLPISAETRAKVDELLKSLDSMIAANKYDPKVIIDKAQAVRVSVTSDIVQAFKNVAGQGGKNVLSPGLLQGQGIAQILPQIKTNA
jgi:hypothetical protein